MIEIGKLNVFHREMTQAWHAELTLSALESPWVEIEENHAQNFRLWHEEDVARRRDVGDARIVEAKRNIDAFNQARNNAMERVDDWILGELARRGVESAVGTLHSETPGMMIDRLSIMALKEFHMVEQTLRSDADEAHRVKCDARVEVLREQQGDLSEGVRVLLAELLGGRRRFKVYRQFKMYNDPALNPQLYGASAR
jgi:hypothetical protein